MQARFKCYHLNDTRFNTYAGSFFDKDKIYPVFMTLYATDLETSLLQSIKGSTKHNTLHSYFHFQGGKKVSVNPSIAAEEQVTTEEVFDLQPLEKILDEYINQKGAVIPILQKIQEAYGYLPKKILALTSKKTGIPISQLYGVATFYSQFHLQRRGRHLIRVCDGTACHVKGSIKNIDAIESAFNIKAGGSSTDYKYTLEIVYCVGSCGLAPVAVVDDQVYAHVKPDSFVRQLKRLE
jgi:NADH:ubiquinone oxidoreductase subunit E